MLTELTGESIEIGIEINQQERSARSVPDGAIIQRSFKILLESKVETVPDADQLVRYAESFTSVSQKILLQLTKSPFRDIDIRYRISKHNPNVIFKNITYKEICKAIDELFQEYEYEMRSLAEDYIEYCNDIDLFDQSRYLMRIVPCGQSLDINKKFGIYFHPSDRGNTQHQFVGIYKDKSVRAMWEIDSVFDVELNGDAINKTLIQCRETDEYDEQLRAIIKDAKEECGYEIANGHRFFCGKPVETDYKKSSSGGIQGARFVNLRDVIGDFNTVLDAATKLRSTQWM